MCELELDITILKAALKQLDRESDITAKNIKGSDLDDQIELEYIFKYQIGFKKAINLLENTKKIFYGFSEEEYNDFNLNE